MPLDHIKDYTVVAGSNTDIDGVNIDEGCAPSGINDAIRELMAHIREWYTDTGGETTSGGTGSTYTLAVADSLTAYVQGKIYAWEVNTAAVATASISMNIGGLGAKPLRKHFDIVPGASDLQAGQIVLAAYENTTDSIQILGGVGPFEPGTKMLFYQAAAPVGWTIDTGVDERFILADKDAGGTTGGTDNPKAIPVNISISISGTTSSGGVHAHTGTTSGPSSTENAQGGAGSTIASSSHTHTISSHTGHTHTFSDSDSDSDTLVPKWAAVIVATKD